MKEILSPIRLQTSILSHRFITFAGVVLAVFVAGTLSAKTLTWQSTASTAWETAGNWFDEGTLATSTTAPTSADAVTINNSRGATAQPSITVTAQACKSLVVGSGFTMTISGGAAAPILTVGDGLTGNNDITIQSGGEIINAPTATAGGNYFGVVSTANDKFRIDSGGRFVHNTTRSYTTPFPAGTQNFDANSTFVFRGSSTIATTVVFSGRTFGNLTIESSSGAYTVTAATGTGAVTINGNLSIGATGAGTVSWTLAAATTSPFNIAGNLSIGSGSTITFPEIPITLVGNLANSGTMAINATSGIFTFNGTATTVSGSATAAFGGGFAINAAKTVSLTTGMSVASGKTGTVNGTLNCGTSTVSGAGNFTVASGATLGIGSATGVDGNITVSGTKTLNTGATYIFNGTAAQTTAGLPNTVSSLTITNALAVASGGVTLSANVTVTNLALTAGRLITGANQVNLADAGTITGGSSASYVDGKLQKIWSTTGTKSMTFPVGSGATYAPCSVANLVLTAAGNLTASTTNSEHANIGTSTIDSTKDANRYWTMTAGGGLAVSTYNATCTFLGGDLDGGANSANFVMEKWNGSSWTRAASSSVAGSTVTGNGFTSLSDFAVGEPAAVATDPAGVGGASPATVGRGNSTLLTVNVTPGTFPTSTGLAVTADLSLIGGISTQQFYDDNTHGDVTPGDNVFSFDATVATGTSIGAKSLSTVISDAQLRTNTAAIISVTVSGATRAWAGSGADDNWSTGINWSGGIAPISPEDSVTFTGSTRLTPALDSSATVPGLTFDSGASSFTLGATGGSTLTLNGGTGVTNNSANTQSVNIPIILGSAQNFNAAGAGTLTIANTVNNGGNLLSGDGANNSSFNGAISGGGGVTKVGTGTMTLSGGNSYGGVTTVNAGTLAVSGGSAIPDASAVVVANVAGATLSVGANETVGSLTGGGATGGTVALGANDLTVGGTTTYSGAITGTGKLVKSGAGTLTLNNAGAIGSSFTTRVEGGTVDFNRGGGTLVGIIGSGNTLELAGGTLQMSASLQANFGVTFNAINVVSDSTFSFNRNSAGTSSQSPVITAPLNFTGNANLGFSYNAQITGGTSSFSGATNTLQGDATLTLGSFGITITGPIVESGGSYSLTKAGAGQLNLGAVNNYSGSTTNLAGVIAVNATSTFGDGTGTLVLAGGDVLDSNTRAAAPITNPILLASAGASTIYGDSTSTSARIFPLGGTLAGTSGTLRIGNKATVANSFQVRLAGGGFDFPRPIVVGDASFDSVNGTSLLAFYNDNSTSPQIFSGVISASAAGSLVRDAAAAGAGGTTVLAGDNTFAGGLIVSRGFIGFGTNSTSSAGVVVSGPVGSGTLEIDNDANVGIFAYGAARTVENPIFLNGVTNVQILGTNDLTLAGLVRVGGVAKTLTVSNTGITTFAGVLTNAAPLTKAGNGTLVLSGTNVNTGGFTVSAGTLALSGNGSIASSPGVNVAGGATLDVSGLSATFVLVGSQTLSNTAAATGELNGNVNTGTGTVSVSYTNGTPAFSVGSGTLTLSAATTFKIDNTGPALTGGSYKIISTNAAGAVAGTLPSVTVGGGGISGGAVATLAVINGELYLLINHPPVANPNTYTRNGLNTWRIAITNLLANATDADGDTLALVGVGTSTNGITLVVGGGYVQYYNPNLVDDEFSYTVTDGNGGTNSALITLTLGSSAGVGGQINDFTANGGTASMSFAGIPGYLYNVQVSTNLTDWNTVWSTNAPGGGLFQYSDNSAPQPNAYYRLMWNGN